MNAILASFGHSARCASPRHDHAFDARAGESRPQAPVSRYPHRLRSLHSAAPAATGEPTGTVAAAGAAATPNDCRRQLELRAPPGVSKLSHPARRRPSRHDRLSLPTPQRRRAPEALAVEARRRRPSAAEASAAEACKRCSQTPPTRLRSMPASRSCQPAGSAWESGPGLAGLLLVPHDNGVTVPTTVAGGPPPSIDRTTGGSDTPRTRSVKPCCPSRGPTHAHDNLGRRGLSIMNTKRALINSALGLGIVASR